MGPLIQYFQEAVRDNLLYRSSLVHFLLFQVYHGILSDSDNIDMANWFYDQPGVGKRRNACILPSGAGDNKAGSRGLRIIGLPGIFEKMGYEWTTTKSGAGFVYPREQPVIVRFYDD